MHGEKLQLLLGGVTRRPGLVLRRPAGRRTTSPSRPGRDPAPRRPRGRRPGLVRRPQLVHGEGEDVGRPRLAHPALVQPRHGRRVDQQHGKLRERMDAHIVQYVPGNRGQGHLVDGYTGFVGDINAHQVRAVSDRASPLRVPVPAGRWGAGRREHPARIAPRHRAAGRHAVRRRRRYRLPGGGLRRRGWSAGEVDVVDAVQDLLHDPQAADWPPGRSTWVTSPVTTTFEPKPEPGEEHLHLLGRGVLRLVEDNERIVQRSAPHESQGRDFDRAGRMSRGIESGSSMSCSAS